MSERGPFVPFAVFYKVGPHYYAFLGTFQHKTPELALGMAREMHAWLDVKARLVAFPWDAATIRSGRCQFDARAEVFSGLS